MQVLRLIISALVIRGRVAGSDHGFKPNRGAYVTTEVLGDVT